MDSLTKKVRSAYKNKIKGGGTTNKSSSKTTKTTQQLLQSQINNYETRLQKAGYTPSELKDTRNPVEKLLNLRPNQNVLFDIFELLNRPQQALFGAIDSVQRNKDVGKGALEGLTGKKYTTGGKLLRNAGMEGTGKGNLFTKEGRKNLSASDFLGFGLDLFADPMDYVLLPVKATATAGKAVKVADSASDVLKGAKLVKAADTIGDTARGISKATAVMDTIGDAGKVTKYVWRPANAALLSYAGQGIKNTFKLGDKGLTKLLSASDARNLTKATKRAAKTGNTVEDVARELGVSTNKAGVYQALKDRIARVGNSSKNLDGLIEKSREAGNIQEVTKTVGQKTMDSLNKDMAKIVNKSAKNADEAAELTNKYYNAIATKIQSKYAYRDITGAEVINRLKKGKEVDFFKNSYAKKVANELKKYNIKVSNDGRYVTLLDNPNKLKALSDTIGSKKFGKFWSAADETDLKSANWIINNTPGLKELYTKADKATSNMAKFSDELTGLNTANIAKEGYLKETLTKEGLQLPQNSKYPTASKAFKGREFKGTPQEYNRLVNEKLTAKQNKLVANPLQEGSKITKRGENAIKSIYKTDDAGNFVRKNGELIRDDNLQKTLVETKKARIEKLQSELTSSKEILKGKDKGLDAIKESKLTTKGARQLNQLKAEKQFTETAQELKKIKFDSVAPEASDSIDNLRKSFKDYRKSKTAYTNALRRKATTPDELKVLRDTMTKNQKIVTNDINVAKAFQNSQSREIIKNANKAFNEGKSLGSSITKELAKSKKAQAKVNEIYQSAADMADSIPKQIRYEQAALGKLENAKDVIFESKSKLIQKQAEAANILASKEGMEYMNTAFNTNFMDFVNENSKLSKSASIYNEALKTGIFTNKKYVKFAEDLANPNSIPYGYMKVNGNSIASKLKGYKGVLPEGMKGGADAIAEHLGGKTLVIDKDLANILGLGDRAVSKEAHPLIKFINGLNNTFKKFSTLTPGFQMRNIVGNSTDMVLSGVPAKELPIYYGKAANVWNNADTIITKVKNGAELTAKEAKQFETLKEFYKAGFANAFEKGNALEDIVKGSKGITGKLSKASVKANEYIDNYNRLALLMYAKDHPKYVEKLGRKSAIDAVRMVLFDPSNMSDIERKYMKKIIPFYTFTKQNLMFQAENIVKNTPKYNKLLKTLNKAYDSVGENGYADYQKDNFQIPLPFVGGNGNQLFLKANLPISDLGEFVSNPIRRTLASTSPIVKTPIELVTGKSMFTGQDANYNVLSKTLNKLGIKSKTAQDSAKAAETVLNGLGLQNVSTNLIRKVQKVLEADKNTSAQELWAELFRTILQNTKQENIVNSGLYDELDQYQAIIKRLKNQGVNIPTMTEINATNKMKLNRLKRKRAYSR